MLTVPPLQVLSWPASWLGIMEPHEERVYHYFKAAHKRKWHGECDGADHDHGSHGIPPDDELWMYRDRVWVWGD